MIKQVIGKQIKELNIKEINELKYNYRHILVDLGTGDGKFAYNYAKNNPAAFVIGIDAAAESMAAVSYKASRKQAKGGLKNVIFIRAAAEQPPSELQTIAHEVYINFPWGSLLTGVVKAQPEIMRGITFLCQPEATVHIYLSYDNKFEPELLADMQLPSLSLDYLQNTLANQYLQYGLAVLEMKTLNAEEKQQLTSSWPKKILSKRDREVFQITAVNLAEDINNLELISTT